MQCSQGRSWVYHLSCPHNARCQKRLNGVSPFYRNLSPIGAAAQNVSNKSNMSNVSKALKVLYVLKVLNMLKVSKRPKWLKDVKKHACTLKVIITIFKTLKNATKRSMTNIPMNQQIDRLTYWSCNYATKNQGYDLNIIELLNTFVVP